MLYIGKLYNYKSPYIEDFYIRPPNNNTSDPYEYMTIRSTYPLLLLKIYKFSDTNDSLGYDFLYRDKVIYIHRSQYLMQKYLKQLQ